MAVQQSQRECCTHVITQRFAALDACTRLAESSELPMSTPAWQVNAMKSGTVTDVSKLEAAFAARSA